MESSLICTSSANLTPKLGFVKQASLLQHGPSLPSIVNLKCWRGKKGGRKQRGVMAMDATFGSGGLTMPKFPRMHVWDPYKLLGVPRDASEEEIRGARNFLLEQYAEHEPSTESIEAAYEKIIMASFRLRKRTKINLKTRLKKRVEESPPWFKRLLEFLELPATDVILRRFALFAFMGGWSITNSAETGPAFQVAVSLAACIYFLNDKMKNVIRASVTGLLALAIGWVCGSVVVPFIPTFLLRPTWSLELLASLVAYVFLFLACTFLK